MDEVDPETALSAVESERNRRRDRAVDALEWFRGRAGLVPRSEAVAALAAAHDWSEAQANRAIGDVVGDLVDPVQQAVHPERGKLVGIIDFREYPDSGAYGYTDYDDVVGERKRVVCSQCVVEADSDAEVAHATEGEGSAPAEATWETLVTTVEDHYETEHDVEPPEVEVGASLASGTTISGNTAFHKGNDGVGSGLSADNVAGETPPFGGVTLTDQAQSFEESNVTATPSENAGGGTSAQVANGILLKTRTGSNIEKAPMKSGARTPLLAAECRTPDDPTVQPVLFGANPTDDSVNLFTVNEFGTSLVAESFERNNPTPQATGNFFDKGQDSEQVAVQQNSDEDLLVFGFDQFENFGNLGGQIEGTTGDIRAGDVDGDGFDEIVFTSLTNGKTYLYGPHDNQFEEIYSNEVVNIIPADLDGDGVAELIGIRSNGDVQLIDTNGNPQKTFLNVNIEKVPNNAETARIDGNVHVFIAERAGTGILIFQDGSTIVSETFTYDIGYGYGIFDSFTGRGGVLYNQEDTYDDVLYDIKADSFIKGPFPDFPTELTDFGLTTGDVNNDGQQEMLGVDQGQEETIYREDEFTPETGSATVEFDRPQNFRQFGKVAHFTDQPTGDVDIFATADGTRVNGGDPIPSGFDLSSDPAVSKSSSVAFEVELTRGGGNPSLEALFRQFSLTE